MEGGEERGVSGGADRESICEEDSAHTMLRTISLKRLEGDWSAAAGSSGCARHCTVIVARMSHWKWRKTKQQPSRAKAGHQISCCLVSLYFLCDILATITVVGRAHSQVQVRPCALHSTPNSPSSSVPAVQHQSHKCSAAAVVRVRPSSPSVSSALIWE